MGRSRQNSWFLIILLCSICFATLGDIELSQDGNKIIWNNNSQTFSLRASGSMSDSSDYIWPPARGSAGQSLIIDSISSNDIIFAFGSPSTSAAHNILSGTHGDAITATVIRGDLIIGQGATPTWQRKELGASGTILRSDGTDAVWAATTLITALGTIVTGTWQATDVGVLYGGTGASTLNDLITLATHTTGDYISDITGGTGIDSTGATSGENISHTLSFDSTEIDATTWSDNANVSNLWQFDVSGTDTTMLAGSGLMSFSHDIAILGDNIEATTETDRFVWMANGSTYAPEAIDLGTDTTGNYADGDAEAGNALTGDTATAFFSAGTIEHERGGLEANVAAFTGLLAIAGGSTSEVDALSELEAQIADVTAFVVEGTACSNIEGTGLSITAGTLNVGGLTASEVSGFMLDVGSPTANTLVKVAADGFTTSTTGIVSDGSGNLSGVGTFSSTGNITWLGNSLALWNDDKKQIFLEENAVAALIFRVDLTDTYFVITTTVGDEKLIFGDSATNPAFRFVGSGLATFGGRIGATSIGAIGDEDLLSFGAGALTVNGTIGATGVITAAGFTIGSAVINEAELETIDGVTAGTAAASKVIVLDASKNITGIGTIASGAVTSSGASQFDSMGIGTSPAAGRALAVAATYSDTSGTKYGMRFDISSTPSADSTAQLYGIGSFGKTFGTKNQGGLTALRATANTDHSAGTLGSATGLRIDAAQTGAGITTARYGLRVISFSKSSGTVVTDYAIRLAEQSSASNNWQIYSEGGKSSFAGKMRLGSNVAPNNALDVTGASTFGDGTNEVQISSTGDYTQFGSATTTVNGFYVAITTKTDTDYTLTINDDVVLFSTSATGRTANLPAASTVTGKKYDIKKIDSGGGSVTLDGNGSEKIDGGLTAIITVQFESITIISDGSNWHIL